MESQRKPIVAFICTHNACRSQIAEFIAARLASDVFVPYSAGTEPKKKIDGGTIKAIREIYGADIEKSQHPKSLSDIPIPDILITMGCGVKCPTLPCRHREDWGLSDPSGQGDSSYQETIRLIESKILNLKSRILKGSL